MIPVMLYIFNLRNLGWMWQDAGLFAAMVASTDAVAVGALLKKGKPSKTWLADVLPAHAVHSHSLRLDLDAA